MGKPDGFWELRGYLLEAREDRAVIAEALGALLTQLAPFANLQVRDRLTEITLRCQPEPQSDE